MVRHRSQMRQTRASAPDEMLLLSPLTPREQDVLRCLSKGANNEQIANALGLQPTTVASYLRTIYGKMQVGKRKEAVDRWRAYYQQVPRGEG